MDAKAKSDWFDRAWEQFHEANKSDSQLKKLSIYQVRTLFQIMFRTRPDTQPDDSLLNGDSNDQE